MELKEKLKIGIAQAISSKGKNKGLLKAKCPPMNTYGSAVWNALQMYSNPLKVSFGHMLFMSKDKKEVYDYIIEVGEIIDLSTFDKDANVLREIGVMK